MRSFKFIDQKAGRVVASLALLLATVLPTLSPALASAAQITSRSIGLTSTTKALTGVSYEINFTSVGAAEVVLVDFCTNTPLIGEACTAPTGFSVSGATESDGDIDALAVEDANTLFIDATVGAAAAKSLTVDTITNPTDAGTIYARIVTYGTDLANAQTQYTAANNLGTYVDTGAVAISITDAIAVDAAVLESLSFCTAAVAITANCGNAAANPPNLTLGEGTPKALTSAQISTGNIFTQLSTNALSGAVVRIKSNNANCSGLALNGGSTCHIAAAGTTGTFTAGTAKFGLFVNPTTGSSTGTGTAEFVSGDATVTGTGTAWVDTPTVRVGDTIWTNGGRAYTVLSITNNTSLELTANASASEATAAYTYGYGTYRVYGGGGTYSNTDYRLDDTAVRSTYGDTLLDTNGGVVNGGNISLTFGASISNVTPAGRHSNGYSLIATGTF